MFWRRKKHKAASNGKDAAAGKADSRRDTGPPRANEPAVFEFGGPVSAGGGLVMKGICGTEESESVQACVWRVEAPSATDTNEPLPKFHIEF